MKLIANRMYEEPSIIVFIKPLAAPGDVVEKRRGYLKSSEKYPRGCISLEVSPLFK